MIELVDDTAAVVIPKVSTDVVAAPVKVAGLNEASTPLGTPVALNVMVPVYPPLRVTVIVDTGAALNGVDETSDDVTEIDGVGVTGVSLLPPPHALNTNAHIDRRTIGVTRRSMLVIFKLSLVIGKHHTVPPHAFAHMLTNDARIHTHADRYHPQRRRAVKVARNEHRRFR